MAAPQQLVQKLWNYCNIKAQNKIHAPAKLRANLDLFWLRDESLEDSANLPPPGDIAREIVGDLETALEQFAEIADDLHDDK